jgi:hypothetical protein
MYTKDIRVCTVGNLCFLVIKCAPHSYQYLQRQQDIPKRLCQSAFLYGVETQTILILLITTQKIC